MGAAEAGVIEPASNGAVLTVNLANMGETLDAIRRKAAAGEGFTLFTVNLDHLVKLDESAPFRAAYERADLVTADGWPVVWLINKEGRGLERTTGADLLEPMCRLAAENAIPVYFVGPGPASQADGLAILKQRYPTLIVAGAETPFVPASLDAAFVDELAQRIEAAGAGVCVLSLGAPKQELLADALRLKCPRVGFVCVGAALDFISGHAVRAPRLVQRAGLEWFWRMVNDPWRLTRRYVGCAFAFFKLNFPAVFRNATRLKLAERKPGAAP